MPQTAVLMPQPLIEQQLDARGFLEGLRRRLLRVTTGMRPGQQRLELAIETFWYAALDARMEREVPWAAISGDQHPLHVLLGPVRLMLRSELIHAGTKLPDALIQNVLERILAVADSESRLGHRDEVLREDFFTWLRRRMRGVMPVAAAVG